MLVSSGPLSEKRPVVVLGAGADKSLGLPLMNDLMRDLYAFSRHEGKLVHETLVAFVKNMRLDFARYAGEKGETFGASLLGQQATLDRIRTLLDRSPNWVGAEKEVLADMVDRLGGIKSKNEFDEEAVAKYTSAFGNEQMEFNRLLDPNSIKFEEGPRVILKRALRNALERAEVLEEQTREQLYQVLQSVMNFEELLSEFFIGYFTKHIPSRKRYFYMAWLFWAYLRFKEEQVVNRLNESIYGTLSELSGFDLLTFNYTGFAASLANGHSTYFHGNNDSLIWFDNREIIDINAYSPIKFGVNGVMQKLASEEIVFEGDFPKVLLPGIVPPLVMKPLLSSEYLEWWYQGAKMIEESLGLIIIGYSFASVDEHFNDLIRKRAKNKKMVLVDPFPDAPASNLCRIVGVSPAWEPNNFGHMECQRCENLLVVRMKAELLSTANMKDLFKYIAGY